MGVALHFSVERFNRFLKNRGWNVTWERALQCPCRSARTGGADPACLVCGGDGFLWEHPTETIIGLSAMNGTRKWALFSEWEQGDAVCTIPSDSPAYHAGEYDRFTINDASYRWTNQLIRGQADRLKYRTIKAIETVWAILGSAKVVFQQGVDYRLDGTTISWLTSTLPVNSRYAVVYVASPEYFVYRDFVQDRPHDGGLALPRRVHVRLMDLFNRGVQ